MLLHLRFELKGGALRFARTWNRLELTYPLRSGVRFAGSIAWSESLQMLGRPGFFLESEEECESVNMANFGWNLEFCFLMESW